MRRNTANVLWGLLLLMLLIILMKVNVPYTVKDQHAKQLQADAFDFITDHDLIHADNVDLICDGKTPNPPNRASTAFICTPENQGTVLAKFRFTFDSDGANEVCVYDVANGRFEE